MKLKQVRDIPNFYINEESGIYYVRRMLNGRLVDRTTGFRHEKSAYKQYLSIMNDMNAEKAGVSFKRKPTLRAWWDKYRAAKTKSPLTWKAEERIMEQVWLKELGTLEVDEITPNMIERILKRRSKEVAESTLSVNYAHLHALLQAAVVEGLLTSHPMRRIPRAKMTVRTRILDLDEQRRLTEQLTPDWQRWLTFMLGTGLRIAEAAGIAPEKDIDWEARTLRVLGKGSKVRTVPMFDDIIITTLKTQLDEEGWWTRKTRIAARQLERAAKRAKIPHVTPHTLRHTFATRYLQGGGDIYVLSKILGHSSVSITEKVYAHLVTQDLHALSKGVKLGLTLPANVLPFKKAHER